MCGLNVDAWAQKGFDFAARGCKDFPRMEFDSIEYHAFLVGMRIYRERTGNEPEKFKVVSYKMDHKSVSARYPAGHMCAQRSSI